MRALCLLAWLATMVATQPARADPPTTITLSIVGTSDLHGHLAALPWLAGYLENLRAARARDGGGVLLLDAGDMFQGTLASNLDEGAAVVAAYNELGYDAVALGNHEFDFGPVGPAPAPAAADDDPRGALKARAAQARFPFLAANLVDRRTRKPVDWPNVKPSVILTAGGIKIGIIGLALEATAHAAFPANVADLKFLPLAQTTIRQARQLRAAGAQVVVVVAHEGGACTELDQPDVPSSCDPHSAIFRLVRRLPRKTVDAIVAGHTHRAIAHVVRGVPVIQSYANGRAFGRIDLTVERRTGKLLASHVERPRDLCAKGELEACKPGKYEGAEVIADKRVAASIEPALAAARERAGERLGVAVAKPLANRRVHESALGNLLADLMLEARPASDVALLNGGGVRAGLPAGPLTYGSLYETFPYDNVFATVRISARQLRALLTRQLSHASALPLLSGLRVRARCKGGSLDVTLMRNGGKALADRQQLTVLTTDFLATGGDGFFGRAKTTIEGGQPVRDAMAEALRKRGGVLVPHRLLDKRRPRMDLPGPVPIKCAR